MTIQISSIDADRFRVKTIWIFVNYYLTYYGPTLKVYANCSPEKQFLLRRDLEKLWSDHNQATGGTTHGISEYLEVIAIRA